MGEEPSSYCGLGMEQVWEGEEAEGRCALPLSLSSGLGSNVTSVGPSPTILVKSVHPPIPALFSSPLLPPNVLYNLQCILFLLSLP